MGWTFATTHLMPRPSFAMAWHKLFEIPAFSDIFLIVHLLSLFNEARTFLSFLWNVFYFHWCFPFLKMAKPFKTLSIVHWILSESHFSHMVCFCASFPQFLIKHNGHLLFHFPHHSNIKRTHTLPLLIWDCIRLREATVGGGCCSKQVKNVRTCSCQFILESWYQSRYFLHVPCMFLPWGFLTRILYEFVIWPCVLHI